MQATALVEKPRSMVLTWADGCESEFHYVWLRDNCRCPACRSPQTHERVSFTGDIPLDIAPKEAKLTPDGGLAIVWATDDMRTDYPADWLYAHRYLPDRPEVPAVEQRHEPKLWGAEFTGEIPTFSYNQVMGSDDGLLEWIETLRDYGLVIIRGVPTGPRPDLDPPGETTANRRSLRDACGEVERFAKHISCVRHDLFDGGTADMKVDPSGYAQALTPIALPLHTDVPCFNWPPGGADAALPAAGRGGRGEHLRGRLLHRRAAA